MPDETPTKESHGFSRVEDVNAARTRLPIKRDVLLGLTSLVMAGLVASIVFGEFESVAVTVSVALALIGCFVVAHWVVGS